MFRKYSLIISLIPVLFGLVLFLSFSQALARPTAQTGPTPVWEEGQLVTSDNNQGDIAIPSVAITPGTNYQTFSGTSFQSTSSSLTYSAQGGAIYATAIPAGGFSFSVEFDLPQGATITEVVFFVVDNDSGNNMDLSLRLYNPETNAFTTLKSATSSGANAALQTIVIPVDPPVQVDNTTNSYRLRVAPTVASSAHLLRGARIGFTLPLNFLPMITK